jgi:FkbM family methyltransferase
MHFLKKIFIATTGYWIHKVSTLPIGTDLYIDMHKSLKYGRFKVMFDVGANVGQTWEWFRSTEPGSKIYCFEPVAQTFTVLKERTSKDKNCVVENIAFGDKQAERTIKIFPQNSSALNSLKDGVMNTDSGASEEIIKIETIDNYCFTRDITKIDFLKIDTEGYEINVLKGAKEMLNKAAISFIFCEIGFLQANNRNTYFSDLTEWLALRDYHFFGLYQLVSNGWKIEFGNSLFVHKSILTS